MITSKDIRPGNILLYRITYPEVLNQPEKWAPVVLTWEDVRLCEERPEYFNEWHSAMPITPEILDKNQNEFEYLGEIRGYKKYLLLTPEKRITIELNKCCYVCVGHHLFETKGFHHLQNILWDLCEKKIKL